jgi:hypothetical protein
MAWVFCNSLDATSLGNMRKRNSTKCRKCKVEFKEGDKAWHRTGRKPVWFHESCYHTIRY